LPSFGKRARLPEEASVAHQGRCRLQLPPDFLTGPSEFKPALSGKYVQKSGPIFRAPGLVRDYRPPTQQNHQVISLTRSSDSTLFARTEHRKNARL